MCITAMTHDNSYHLPFLVRNAVRRNMLLGLRNIGSHDEPVTKILELPLAQGGMQSNI